MRHTLDFFAEEKTIILAAVKHEKGKLLEYNNDPITMGSYDQEIKEVIEIEEEIKKDNVLLSRNQLIDITAYLGELVETNQFDSSDIYELDSKLNEIIDLP